MEAVKDFPYLGSLIECSGRMDADVNRRVAQASKAFGALRKAACIPRKASKASHQEESVYIMCVSFQFSCMGQKAGSYSGGMRNG